jgi:hypothetical protein
MAMTAADEIRDHQARCQPHMFRLLMLARGEAGLGLAAVEVGEATGAVIAEAEASSRAALAAGADGSHPGAGTFLRVRLDRLTVAADEAVAAARHGNPADLRLHLLRFEALTSAIWTVQDSLYGQLPSMRPEPVPPA